MLDWPEYKAQFQGFVIKGPELYNLWRKDTPIDKAKAILTKRGRKWQYAVKHRRYTIDQASGDMLIAQGWETVLVKVLEHRMPDDLRARYEEMLRRCRVTIRGPENQD